jgi:hypothetical protein
MVSPSDDVILRPIHPPVLDGNNYMAVEIIETWDTDDHVFYLVRWRAAPNWPNTIWVHTKEKGIGGRTFNPDFKTWEDFYRGNAPCSPPPGYGYSEYPDSEDPEDVIHKWLEAIY